MVSVHDFVEAAQHAVGIGTDSNAVKICSQAIMPNAQSKFSNCLLLGQSGILADICVHGF